MGIWESMQVAASPAWEFGNPCRQRRHPHGNLEIHAGGGVTRMEKIESSGHKPADCTSERRNMPISKQIRVRRGYTKLSHHDFWLVLRRLYEGLLKNPHFPKPPVDLGLFKTKIDKYSAAITATMGGAKIAFSQRDSLREDLTKMLLELAGYVEAESYNDPAIFATSGLEALPSAHVPHQPLDRPRIPKIDHGAVSGELLVWMPPSLRKIIKYDLRHAPVDADGVPTGEWTERIVTSSQGPVSIKNLKPGTVYAFQIRALGKLGHTDWSDSVTKMCT